MMRSQNYDYLPKGLIVFLTCSKLMCFKVNGGVGQNRLRLELCVPDPKPDLDHANVGSRAL